MRAATTTSRLLLWLIAGFLATAAAASAQPAAASFEVLNERLQIGQLVWVTDPTGREARGRIEQLSNDGLVLRANGSRTFAAADIRRLRTREHDSVKNGALIGLGIGVALGTAWCISAVADDSGDVNGRVECAEGFTVYPGLGALLGLAVDRVIPGRIRVIYETSLAHHDPRSRPSVVPAISTRTERLAVSFTF